MRIVVDTNFWVSYLLKPSAPFSSLATRIQDYHTPLYSHASLSELAEVLTREKFRKYLDKEDIRAFLKCFAEMGEEVNVTSVVCVCRDVKDNMILALAIDGRADMIISGDNDLLTLHPHGSIPILTPADALTLL